MAMRCQAPSATDHRRGEPPFIRTKGFDRVRVMISGSSLWSDPAWGSSMRIALPRQRVDRRLRQIHDKTIDGATLDLEAFATPLHRRVDRMCDQNGSHFFHAFFVQIAHQGPVFHALQRTHNLGVSAAQTSIRPAGGKVYSMLTVRGFRHADRVKSETYRLSSRVVTERINIDKAAPRPKPLSPSLTRLPLHIPKRRLHFLEDLGHARFDRFELRAGHANLIEDAVLHIRLLDIGAETVAQLR
jgi:hypothetical protein